MFMPERLVEIRNRLGLTKEALARLLGVGVSSIQRWERGGTGPVGPSLQVYRALDRALSRGHSAAEILGAAGGDPGQALAQIFSLGFMETPRAT